LIILAKTFGDHSNRLFQGALYDAFCKNNGWRFVDLSFTSMARHYPNIRHKGWTRALHYLVRLLRHLRLVRLTYVETAEALEACCRKRRLVFLRNGVFLDMSLLRDHRNYLVHRYTLHPALLEGNRVVSQMREWKSQGIAILGVHVRRGDYAQHEGGRYYYDDATYCRMIDTTSDLLRQQGRDVRCVICSENKVALDTRQAYVFAGGAWYVDQYLLGQCDYIIGPPSTFTLWASFMGDTRYFHMTSPTDAIRLEAFTKLLQG